MAVDVNPQLMPGDTLKPLKMTSFMDETGHSDDPNFHFAGMAGFIAPAELWYTVGQYWQTVLKMFSLKEPFHMKDFAHSQGQFKDWKGKEERRKSLYGFGHWNRNCQACSRWSNYFRRRFSQPERKATSDASRPVLRSFSEVHSWRCQYGHVRRASREGDNGVQLQQRIWSHEAAKSV
jgi:hypothetical protein